MTERLLGIMMQLAWPPSATHTRMLHSACAGAQGVQQPHRRCMAAHCAAQWHAAVLGSGVLWRRSTDGQVGGAAGQQPARHDSGRGRGGIGLVPRAAGAHRALVYYSLGPSRGGAAAGRLPCPADAGPGCLIYMQRLLLEAMVQQVSKSRSGQWSRAEPKGQLRVRGVRRQKGEISVKRHGPERSDTCGENREWQRAVFGGPGRDGKEQQLASVCFHQMCGGEYTRVIYTAAAGQRLYNGGHNGWPQPSASSCRVNSRPRHNLQAAVGRGTGRTAAAAAAARLLLPPRSLPRLLQVCQHLPPADLQRGFHGGMVRGVQRLVVRGGLQAKHLGGQHPAGGRRDRVRAAGRLDGRLHAGGASAGCKQRLGRGPPAPKRGARAASLAARKGGDRSLDLVAGRRPDIHVVQALKVSVVHQRRLDAGGPRALRAWGWAAGGGGVGGTPGWRLGSMHGAAGGMH